MKKRNLILMLFLSLSLSGNLVFSQNVEIKWGQNQVLKNFIARILGEDQSGMYTLSSKSKKLFIEKYSPSDFKQLFSKELVLPERNGKKEDFEALFFLKGKLVLFTSSYNKDTDKFSTYAYAVSADGVLSKSSTTIFDIESEKKNERGDFQFFMSSDSTKLLIYNNHYVKKDKKQYVDVKVIDGDLRTTAEFSESFPLKEEGMRVQITNVQVDNTGNVFMAIKHIASNGKMDFTILAYQLTQKNKVVFPIDLDKEKISSLTFSLTKSGQMHVSGYYVEQGGKGLFAYDGIAGVFFLTLDLEKKQILSQKTTPFGKELLKGFLRDKQIEKGRLLPADFIPTDIKELADGSQILVSEQFSQYTNYGNSFKTTTTTYGCILVSKINADGTAAWSRIIAKSQLDVVRQMSVGAFIGVGLSFSVWLPLEDDNTVFFSYLMGIKDDKMIFVFNDNKKNVTKINAREIDYVDNVRRAIPMVVTLDMSGNVTKKPLFGNEDSEVIMRPRISLQVNSTSVIVYGTKGKNDQFGRVIFK